MILSIRLPMTAESIRIAEGVGSVATVLLAAAGQYALTGRKDLNTGAFLYAAAIVALLASVLIQRAPTGQLGSGGSVRIPHRLFVGIAAAFAHAAAIFLIFTDAPALLLAVLLWLLSLVLTVGVALRAHSPDWRLGVIRSRLQTAFAHLRVELLALAMLLVAGGVLRFAVLESVPTGVHGDETEFGLIAASVLRGGGPNPFGTAFLGDPALFTYLEAPFIAIFGQTMTALRIVAAITGTLTLVSLYALARSLFGWRPAFLATALLAGAAVHVHFSRMGLNVIQVPLFASVSLFFLWRGHRTRVALWWLLSGMAAGGAVYFHFGARLLPVIIALFMVYTLALSPRQWRAWLAGVVFLSLGAAMALSPMVAHLARQSYKLTEHVESRLIVQNWDRVASQHGTGEPLGIYWGQLKLNVLAFVSQRDASTFYTFTGAPLLNGLAAPLFVLGLALVIFRLRDARYGLIFFWFWTVVIFGGALTFDSPQYHRLLPAVLPGLIGAGLILDWLVATWTRLVSEVARPALTVVAALATLVAGVYDANAYFGRYAEASPWPDVTAQARAVAALGPTHQVFVVGRPFVYASHGNTRYLAGDVGATDLANLSAQLPVPPLGKPLAFLVNPGLQDWLSLLQLLYPGGETKRIENPPGRLVLTEYRVPIEVASQPWPEGQGLAAEFRSERQDRPIVQRVDWTLGFLDLAALVPEGNRPFRANWRGELLVGQPGAYELELYTDGGAILRLDGQVQIQGEQAPEQPRSLRKTVTLTAGPHPIEIEYRWVRGPGFLELLWRPPGAQRQIVPPSAFRPTGG